MYDVQKENLISFDFHFTSSAQVKFEMNRTELYFGAGCGDKLFVDPQKLNAAELEIYKNCRRSTLLVEDDAGYFQSLPNLAKYPKAGPYAGKNFNDEMALIEPDTITLLPGQAFTYHFEDLPDYILFPASTSKKVRFYYFFRDLSGRKHVGISNWLESRLNPDNSSGN